MYFLFAMIDSVSRSGFHLGSALGNFLGSAFFVSVHSAIFAGLIYFILPKYSLYNIADPANKIIKIALLLFIPVLIFIMVSQYKNYLREEAEWYEDDIPAKQQYSIKPSGNNQLDLTPSPVESDSFPVMYQPFPTISLPNPTATAFNIPTAIALPTSDNAYIPNVYPISDNNTIVTSNQNFRFKIGDHGYICTPGGVNLRSEPYLDNEYKIKTLQYQSTFVVIGGPVIDNFTTWWQVDVDNEGVGWLSEGHDNLNSDYLLCSNY